MTEAQASQAIQTGEVRWVRWVDPDRLISMLLPAHWWVHREAGLVLRLLGPAAGGKRPGVTIHKISVPAIDRMIIEVIERQTLDRLRQEHPDFKLLERRTLTLDRAIEANLFRVSWSNSKGTPLVQTLLLVSGGLALYQLVATAPAGGEEQIRPLVEKMFGSLRFRLLPAARARSAG